MRRMFYPPLTFGLLVALVFVGPGCASYFASRRAADAREAQQRQQADLAFRRDQEARAAEANRVAAWQAYYDRLCVAPATSELLGWCTQREREKDRELQRQQWATENAARQQEIDLERSRVDAETSEYRRRAINDAFAPLRQQSASPAYSPPQTTNCTSNVIGTTVFTNCN